MDLTGVFSGNTPRAALAFSGGVDSAYLLYAAKRWGTWRCRAGVFCPVPHSSPNLSWEDARRLAEALQAPTAGESPRQTSWRMPQVAANAPKTAVIHCKKRHLFAAIADTRRLADGYSRAAGRHQRLRRRRRPARYAGPAGAGGALPPAGVRR